MSSLTCPGIPTIGKGEVNRLYVDWGENTAAQKTGCLSAGDTVSSCTVSVDSKPTGASDPTLGSVTVPANSSSDDINGRVWSQGEATVCTVTMASNQTEGTYRLKFVATTASGYTLPRYVMLDVKAN